MMKILKTGLKISILLFIFFNVVKPLSAEEKVDIDIEKGLEIFGVEEKPRVLFFLPEYKPDFEPFGMTNDYILKKEEIFVNDLIKRDIMK